jgi:tRNA threonylcarbamoyl adenosine modification protein YjeE
MSESNRILELQVNDADEMHALGIRLAHEFRAGDLVVLVGPLGAGKTTLTRGIGEGLHAIGNVSSPTFVIARTHQRESSSVPIVHVDAYRLGSADELDDLDIDFANSIVIVEWGKGMLDGVSENWLEVEIARENAVVESEDEADVREVKISGFGERWKTVTF